MLDLVWILILANHFGDNWGNLNKDWVLDDMKKLLILFDVKRFLLWF